jgi:hypothetical protein
MTEPHERGIFRAQIYGGYVLTIVASTVLTASTLIIHVGSFQEVDEAMVKETSSAGTLRAMTEPRQNPSNSEEEGGRGREGERERERERGPIDEKVLPHTTKDFGSLPALTLPI